MPMLNGGGLGWRYGSGKWAVGSVGRNGSGSGNRKWDQWEGVAVEMGRGIIEDTYMGEVKMGNWISGEIWKRKWEVGRYGSGNGK